MGLTEKQKNILLNNGWTENDIANTPYEEASDAIGEILAEPRKPSRYKEIKEPKKEFVERQGFKPANKYEPMDKKSFYVAYSKDLTIAMMEFQAELVKAGFIKDIKQLETVDEIAKRATAIIKAIKKEFE